MSNYLNLAIRQASKSQCRFKVGAVLTKGGRIMGHACNHRRNLPSTDFRHATFHAEEVLIRRIRMSRGSVIHVARVNRAGSPLLARPCLRCQQTLAASGVVRAYYTTGSGSGLLRFGRDAASAGIASHSVLFDEC
ncbi:hypothetical protein [Streptomyces albireticuli]|uniref:CMP/dCMP-type deaminase domain-containing protein n=1 Tax=Streptomyces albireticuli TaxID=1940 RepID=A0A2A2DF63_9ACTN|nr:hypothetical protein CK936_04260 [Streptomyces albireticuli]